MINKNDIVKINKEFGDGSFNDESSLDSAFSAIKNNYSLDEVSLLVRNLLFFKTFSQGNEKTALITALTYFNDKKLVYDKDRILKNILSISKNEISDVNKVQRMIKSAIIL